jgi:hypothetical protein
VAAENIAEKATLQFRFDWNLFFIRVHPCLSVVESLWPKKLN